MTPPSVDGHAELVVVGEVAYLLPAIRPDMSPRLRRLLELRRAATIAQRCPRCSASAVGGAPLAPRLGELVMEHEVWCPVADHTVGPLLARYWQGHARRRASDGGGAMRQ
jgi:hypothetical protein